MKYLSLFSGIEAASVAWEPLGWKPVAFSEVDKFSCKFLAHKYPSVPNLGDATKITEKMISQLGRIDLVVFGSPCQDLSVAGQRKGLIDDAGGFTRSGLFFSALNIFNWAKKHCGARYALWENVPGAFSSNSGRDFASVVSSMAGLDDVITPKNGWGNEGIALGENGLLEWATLDAQWFGVAQRRRRLYAVLDTGNWQSRRPILLEPKSMRGITPPSREAREKIASFTPGGFGNYSEGVGPRRANDGQRQPCVMTFGRQSSSEYDENQGASTLLARDYKGLTDLVAYGTPGNWIGRKPENGGNAVDPMLNVAPCQTTTDVHAVAHISKVRRLTPLECERLQGFPDNYTNFEGASDTARYKALGNSMAVPVMRWIGKKIESADWIKNG